MFQQSCESQSRKFISCYRVLYLFIFPCQGNGVLVPVLYQMFQQIKLHDVAFFPLDINEFYDIIPDTKLYIGCFASVLCTNGSNNNYYFVLIMVLRTWSFFSWSYDERQVSTFPALANVMGTRSRMSRNLYWNRRMQNLYTRTIYLPWLCGNNHWELVQTFSLSA